MAPASRRWFFDSSIPSAAASLLLSQNIPSQPAIGNEAVFGRA